MTASAIKSTVTAGETSSVQSAFAIETSQNINLFHHVYSKRNGWSKKGAMDKPFIMLNAKVDIPAYLTLKIRVPNTPIRPAWKFDRYP